MSVAAIRRREVGAPDVAARVERAWAVLADVLDPELPVVSIRDLGIVRDVHADGDRLVVVLTPTYSGCPATEWIERSVRDALDAEGLAPSGVEWQRAPAWTTDWISAEGRRLLREHGIAPPGPAAAPTGAPLRFVPAAARRAPAVQCPRCASLDTACLSTFGSTACKALYRCNACGEPFEFVKPI
ncbi:1,2-phenylacetyl-CoA epoxidase subunit PaaD [Piscinibacter koreensis]|uniref:1,2-phenylacetyl-CoA epoxidase subunit PaaD n=1 Tax=Piscinibacter koreensis TaxID=2742824 RepID=UPI0031591204